MGLAWLHPHVESCLSLIAGVFACQTIHPREVICRWEGVVYTCAEIQGGLGADPL